MPRVIPNSVIIPECECELNQSSEVSGYFNRSRECRIREVIITLL